LATAIGMQGRADESIAEFKRAIDLDPRDPQPMMALAGLLAQTGRSQEATQWQERAQHAAQALQAGK
jgi:Flp pilus assembly protein TadD